MIAMEVADENMVDALHPDPVPPQLQLGTFRTIDQEKPIVVIKKLSCRESFYGRNGRIASKYDNLKYH